MRTSSVRSEIVVNFPNDSNTLNSGHKRSTSIDHFTNRDHRHDREILQERLKHIREKSFTRWGNNSTGHSQSLRISNGIEEEPSETQRPLIFGLSSIGMEEKSRPCIINEQSSAIVILE